MKAIRLAKLMPLIIFSLCFTCLYSGTVAAESTVFTVSNTTAVLELTVPNVATLNLNPTSGAVFGTANLAIVSGTNNPTGYVLTMSVPDTNLTNSSVTLSNPTVPVDSSNHPIIPTLASGSYGVSNFTTNAWGYKLSTADNYSPVPSSVELINTNSAGNASTTTLNFAAKVDSSRYTGTYSTAINFTAVTNAPPVYTFDDAYEIAGKTKHNGYYTMQDATSAICTAVETGQTGTLIDTRDNTLYRVGKLADDRCWMLENLALDLTSQSVKGVMYSSTADDTYNTGTNAKNSTLGYLFNGGGSSPYTNIAVANANSSNYYNRPAIAKSGACNDAYCVNNPTSGNWTYDSVTQTTINGKTSYVQGKIGIYYNFCAASAGSYCYTSGNAVDDPDTAIDAAEDICPSGWRMPTGGPISTSGNNNGGGEFQNLYNKYNNAKSFQEALSTPLSGNFGNGKALSQGYYGGFWSSTRNSGSIMYYLYVDSTSVNPQSNYIRSYGFSMRCIMND